MPRKKSEPHRDQNAFDIWWSQRDFFTQDPRYNIYKEIYPKGADLEFIDCLTQCLLFADSLDTWRGKASGRRRGAGVPMVGKLRRSLQNISFFLLDAVNFSRQEERKETWSSGMKEVLRAHLLISCATNPEDFRFGGQSDRCGTFFLLAVTEHFREQRVKPRYKLAARLLRNIRGQRSLPANTGAINAKVRLDRFKKQTPDWQFRLDEFLANLHYLATT